MRNILKLISKSFFFFAKIYLSVYHNYLYCWLRYFRWAWFSYWNLIIIIFIYFLLNINIEGKFYLALTRFFYQRNDTYPTFFDFFKTKTIKNTYINICGKIFLLERKYPNSGNNFKIHSKERTGRSSQFQKNTKCFTSQSQYDEMHYAALSTFKTCCRFRV